MSSAVVIPGEWQPTGVHAVFDADGVLMAESSNESEIRSFVGDDEQHRVFQLWCQTNHEWRYANSPTPERAAEAEEYRRARAEDADA